VAILLVRDGETGGTALRILMKRPADVDGFGVKVMTDTHRAASPSRTERRR